MSRTRPPICDRCGAEIEQLGDALMLLRFDADELLVGATLDHRACARDFVPPAGERVELLEPIDALHPRVMVRLTELARVHDAASVTRVLRKAGRLGPNGAA